MGVSILLQGPGDGGLQVETAAGASLGSAASPRTDGAQGAVKPRAASLKENAATFPKSVGGARLSKRRASQVTGQEIAEKMASEKRGQALAALAGMAEHKPKFEDLWNTTEFQKRMLLLCQTLYPGQEDAISKFHLLNDVRADITTEGQTQLKHLFGLYAALGSDSYQLSALGARAKSIDFNEFKQCLIDLKLLPARTRGLPDAGEGTMVNLDVLATIFKGVNENMEGIDDDASEFSFEEFFVAMCLVAVYCNRSMDSILFPGARPTESLSDIKKQKEEEQELQYSTSGLASLIKQEHMRILQSLFVDAGGEMTIEQFCDNFGTLLCIATVEAEKLFYKIDYNNNGGISWDEFAGYIIALGSSKRDESEPVLEYLVNPKVKPEFIHRESIGLVALVESNQWRPGMDKYVTFSKDGAINVWNGCTGIAQKQDNDFSLQGNAKFLLSACALTMVNGAGVSSNDQVVRFYGFEPRFHSAIEYITEEEQCVAKCTHTHARAPYSRPCAGETGFKFTSGSRATAMHSFAAKLGVDGAWLSWFVWGDDFGCVHFIPEKVLWGYRSGSHVVQVKSSEVAKQHPDSVFTVNLFTGWVSCIHFEAEIGQYGALVVGSNDGSVVIFDPDSRRVAFRHEGHSMAVKCLAFLKAYRSVASSGLDRDIFLWDPKAGLKTGRLSGHKAPVINLCYFERMDLLFSLDLRYQLHIWDASKQILIKQINTDEGDPFVTKNRFRSQCMLLNHFRGDLVICGKRPFLWKIAVDDSAGEVVLHEHPPVCVLYNELFNQIITVDHSGLVLIWEFRSGKQASIIRLKHKNKDGTPDDICVAVLDPLERNIVVGYAGGKIISYSLINGKPTNEFWTSANAKHCSEYPIVGMHFSKAVAGGDMDQGPAQDAQFFASGLHYKGPSCVWIWTTTSTVQQEYPEFEIAPAKIMLLPSWRNDNLIDYTPCLMFKLGILACGRSDGHVMLWNAHTGFLKRDVDQVFWHMDTNNDGDLSYEEVSSFLRSREGYSDEEIATFIDKADIDQSGSISKAEFQLMLDRRGTVSKVDPDTGKLMYDRPGSTVVMAHLMMRIDHCLLTVTADGYAMFALYNQNTLLHGFNANLADAALSEAKARDHFVTSCTVDEKETILIVGTSSGCVYVWDIQFVTAKAKLEDKRVHRIGSWKNTSCDDISCIVFVEKQRLILLVEHFRDLGKLPETVLYSLDGEKVGTLNGDSNWMLERDEQAELLQRLGKGIDLSRANTNADDGKDVFQEVDVVATLKRVEKEAAPEKKTTFRDTKLAKKEGLFKGSAITFINRNFMRLKALRYQELQQRLKRARLFLETRMGDTAYLHKQTLDDMEDIWRSELETCTLDDFHANKTVQLDFTEQEESALFVLQRDERVLLLVRKFVFQFVLNGAKGDDYMVPPSEQITTQAHAFVIDQWEKYVPHHPASPPGGASGEQEGKKGTAIEGEGENTEVHMVPAPWSHKDPWFNKALIRCFLTSQMLAIKISTGAVDVLEHIKADENLPIVEQSRVFREQYRYSPHWDPEVDTAEVRKRTLMVAAECKKTLESRDILAQRMETWLSRTLSRDPGDIPAPPVGFFKQDPDVLGNEVGSAHHHLIGPISLRRISARGPHGVEMLEKQMPYPGEKPPDTYGWEDLYVPELAAPFQLQEPALPRSSRGDGQSRGLGVGPAPGGLERSVAEQIFECLDSDNDGLLSKKDIESVLCNSKAKSALTSADVDAVFEQIDLDGEGTLSLDQFLSYFARAETVVASNVSVGNEKASPTDSKRCGKGIFKSGQKGQRGAASKGLREEGLRIIGRDASSLIARLTTAFEAELDSRVVTDHHLVLVSESNGREGHRTSSRAASTASRSVPRNRSRNSQDAVGGRPSVLAQTPAQIHPTPPTAKPETLIVPRAPNEAMPSRRTPRPQFVNSPRKETGKELPSRHPRVWSYKWSLIMPTHFETPMHVSTRQSARVNSHASMYRPDSDLAESLLPPIESPGPRGHSLPDLRHHESRASPESASGSALSRTKEHLVMNLLVALGDSVEDVDLRNEWHSRRLSLEENTIYIHHPFLNEEGRMDWAKQVLCALRHDCSIERVFGDSAKARRSAALRLSWGPASERLQVFLAGNDYSEVLEWLLQVNHRIDDLVQDYLKRTQVNSILCTIKARRHTKTC